MLAGPSDLADEKDSIREHVLPKMRRVARIIRMTQETSCKTIRSAATSTWEQTHDSRETNAQNVVNETIILAVTKSIDAEIASK